MKKFKIILLTFMLSFSSVSEKKYFSNTSGEILDDLLIGFNYETKDATFERSGKIPLETFSDSDQEYILKWNETKGFYHRLDLKYYSKKKDGIELKVNDQELLFTWTYLKNHLMNI